MTDNDHKFGALIMTQGTCYFQSDSDFKSRFSLLKDKIRALVSTKKSPEKSSEDDLLSFSKFGCTWHSPNKFVLCTRLHEFSAPRGGMGISALLLRSIFSLTYGKAAGLRPLPTAVPISRNSWH